MADLGMPASDPLLGFLRTSLLAGRSGTQILILGPWRVPAHRSLASAARGVAYQDFRFSLTARGGADFSTPQGESIPLEPGTLLWRAPGLRHSIHYRAGGYSEFAIVAPPSIYAVLVEFSLLDPSRRSIRLADPAPLFAALREASAAFHRARHHAARLIALLDIFRMVEREVEASTRRRGDGLVLDRARALLAAKLDQPLSMESVARASGMPYEKFRRIFKEATGLSPKDYRLSEKMDRAKLLLMDRGLSATAIAERLGYPEVFAFLRQFKRRTGETPGAFRNRYLGPG